MKLTLLIFFVMTFYLAVPAQKKLTDKEIEGLKGAVKTVFEENMVIYVSSGPTKINRRHKISEYYFDKDGTLTQLLYPSSNNKYVFTIIDGFKTFKSSPIKEDNAPKNMVTGVSVGEEEPIEKPEKLVSPDERFTMKYVYEYGIDGEIKTERHYGNNGKLWRLTTYKYDKKRRVSEETKKESGSTTKYFYKYDKDDNLIETSEDRDVRFGVDSKSKTIYSDYKIDAQGNWTQRKLTETSKTQNDSSFDITTIYYRTIAYF